MYVTLTKAACCSLASALRTILHLASVVFLVGLALKVANEPPDDLAPPSFKTAHFRDRLGRVVVTVEDDEQHDFAKLIVRDREGQLLLNGKVYTNQRVFFSLGNETVNQAVQSVGYSSPNGGVCLGIQNRTSRYKLLASKDGSSVLEWVDLNKEVVRRFHVTSDGDFVDETPVDLWKNAQGSHPPTDPGGTPQRPSQAGL